MVRRLTLRQIQTKKTKYDLQSGQQLPEIVIDGVVHSQCVSSLRVIGESLLNRHSARSRNDPDVVFT